MTHVRCNPSSDDSGDEQQRRGGRFENTSDATAAGYKLMQNGILKQMDNGDFLLDTSITIHVAGQQPVSGGGGGGGGFGGDGGSSQRSSKSTIHSEIVAPLNHPVLLSFSGVNNVDSALIVTLIESE